MSLLPFDGITLHKTNQLVGGIGRDDDDGNEETKNVRHFGHGQCSTHICFA